MINNTIPKSGWLNKLTTNNTFGTSRWQARYFVLLDTELRYYKNEHSTTASRIINLRDISKVIITDVTNRQYCFKLEPTLYYQTHQPTIAKNQKKMWTMQCNSEYELESWIAAINLRLSKLCSDEDIISPTLQPFSTSEEKRKSPLNSLFSLISSNAVATHSSRPLKHSAPSISRRRGVILSPLEVSPMPRLEPSDMVSSSSSKCSGLPSPAGSDSFEEEDIATMNGRADKLTTRNAYVIDTSSPTYALYKERFHI